MRSSLIVLSVVAVLFASAVTAEADTIYTTVSGNALGTIDTVTGVGTNVGSTGTSGTWAAAFDNDGTLYTTVNWGQFLGKFNLTTGAVTTIGSAQSGANLIALEVDSSGTLYGADWSGRLWTIDKTTGVRTLVGGGGVTSVMDLAFDSSGTLWATTGNRLWTVNTSTGAATFVTNISGISRGSVMGIMFDENDTLYATAWISNSPLYTVNTSTGVATVIGTTTGLGAPHGGDIFIDPDTDGDGIPDDEDDCVNSDLSATIVIDGCDSGVTNTLFDTGCTMSDLIAECAAEAKNHGAFVSCVAHLTNSWKKAGLITGKEKGKIQSCAAQSSLP